MKITSSLKFLYISWRSGLLCAALGVIAQFFDIIFISRDGTKIDYKKRLQRDSCRAIYTKIAMMAKKNDFRVFSLLQIFFKY